jgi:hypothetical protein
VLTGGFSSSRLAASELGRARLVELTQHDDARVAIVASRDRAVTATG